MYNHLKLIQDLKLVYYSDFICKIFFLASLQISRLIGGYSSYHAPLLFNWFSERHAAVSQLVVCISISELENNIADILTYLV